MVLLTNIYQSEETLPYVVSTEPFASVETAMKAAHDSYEDAMVNEYCENYEENELEVTIDDRNIYVKGPDFVDWWSVMDVPEVCNKAK